MSQILDHAGGEEGSVGEHGAGPVGDGVGQDREHLWVEERLAAREVELLHSQPQSLGDAGANLVPRHHAVAGLGRPRIQRDNEGIVGMARQSRRCRPSADQGFPEVEQVRTRDRVIAYDDRLRRTIEATSIPYVLQKRRSDFSDCRICAIFLFT